MRDFTKKYFHLNSSAVYNSSTKKWPKNRPSATWVALRSHQLWRYESSWLGGLLLCDVKSLAQSWWTLFPVYSKSISPSPPRQHKNIWYVHRQAYVECREIKILAVRFTKPRHLPLCAVPMENGVVRLSTRQTSEWRGSQEPTALWSC